MSISKTFPSWQPLTLFSLFAEDAQEVSKAEKTRNGRIFLG
jgi:hypothetical protein